MDRDWVIGAIPAVLAWVPGGGGRRQPYAFEIEHLSASNGRPKKLSLAVGWSVEALERHDPSLRDSVRRMRAGRTVQREHIVELAGYGLAFCAISVLLPGERVVDMERGRSPDFLFESPPRISARSGGRLPNTRRMARPPGGPQNEDEGARAERNAGRSAPVPLVRLASGRRIS
jgi:hypothetical protein